MMDAKQFANLYSAFWQTFTPSCELFVRDLNLFGYKRWEAPLENPTRDVRSSLCAEYAFSRFSIEHRLRKSGVGADSGRDIHRLAWEEATGRLAFYALQGLDLETPFSKNEQKDAVRLSGRLKRFFTKDWCTMTMRPRFPGCGYVDMSEGDVLDGPTLYEVKAVNRMFRSIDLRQLLTYAALNWSANNFEIDRIGVFNPRRGIFFEYALDEVCIGVSGNPPEILLPEIIETISSGEISR